MAFENFFRRDRDRDTERQDWRSEDDWRERRGQRESGRGFGADDERDFERRGWREGSDYYGNRDERYGRSSYRLGDRSAQDYGRERGFGGRDWRNEGSSYGGEFSAGSYTRGDFGEGSYDRMTRGSFKGMSDHRGRGPRGYRRSDERVREDVCEALTEDSYLDASNMEVQVKDCEVTLSGSVTSREDKRRAEDLVERISGVADVHNQLRVASDQRAAAPTGQGTQAGQTGQVAKH